MVVLKGKFAKQTAGSTNCAIQHLTSVCDLNGQYSNSSWPEGRFPQHRSRCEHWAGQERANGQYTESTEYTECTECTECTEYTEATECTECTECTARGRSSIASGERSAESRCEERSISSPVRVTVNVDRSLVIPHMFN